MSFDVVIAPEDTLLTTRRMVKAILGLTQSDDSHDFVLDQLIKEASDFAVSYCGRHFAKQKIVEHLEGNGLPDLVLDLTPIIQIHEIKYDTQIVTDYVVKDADAGIIQRPGAHWVSTVYGWAESISPHPSPYAENRWHVTYTAGYVLPGWEIGVRNLPYDLERAVIEMCKTNYVNMKVDGSLSSYRIGETQASWARASRDMSSIPDSAINILSYYRRSW